MATVWLRLRADVRLGWRTLAALALLLGLVGGVVLTAAAGARRTDTAYPRLLSWASATQVDILPFSGEPAPRYYAAMARLPQAAAVSAQILYQIALPARHGTPQLVDAFSSPDGTLGVSADRVKIVQGRMFSSRAPDQAVIDPQLASLVHLRPGGTLHLLGIPDNPRTGEPDLSRAIPLAFRVTAIGVFDTQIVPANASFSGPMVLLSPPFTATRAAQSIYVYGDEAGVRLRPGASMTAFLHDAETLARRFPATGGKLAVISLSDQVTATERAIRPQAVALAIFAVLAGLVGLAVIGQLLARQMVAGLGGVPHPSDAGHDPGQPGRAGPGPAGRGHVRGGRPGGGGGRRGLAADAYRPGPAGRAGPGDRGQPGRAGGGPGRGRGAAAGRAGAGRLAGRGPGRRPAGGGRAGRPGRRGWPGWRAWPGRCRAAWGCGWRSSRDGGGPRYRCAARWPG